MSIGAVLAELLPDFPDVTVSKIRFLETEGLVTPARTAARYRQYTAYDLARLRYILTAQRDNYLPLKVIKAELDAQPDGELPAAATSYGAPRLVGAEPAVPARVVRLSREDLVEASGIARGRAEDLLTALTKAGVITPIFKGRGAVLFDEHSVVILQCANALADFGVEPRHLRAFRSAADRQSDLIAQIAGPLVKTDKAGARDRADDLAREVAALAITLHTSLIRSAVRDALQR